MCGGVLLFRFSSLLSPGQAPSLLRWWPQLSQPHHATHRYQTLINSAHTTTHTIHVTRVTLFVLVKFSLSAFIVQVESTAAFKALSSSDKVNLELSLSVLFSSLGGSCL